MATKQAQEPGDETEKKIKDTGNTTAASSAGQALIIGTADPLLMWLERLRLKPLSLAILTLLVFNVPLILYAWAIGGLYGHKQLVGLLEDPTFLFVSLVVVPFTWAAYLWLPHWINNVVGSIQENRIILEPKPGVRREDDAALDLDRYTEELEDIQSRRLLDRRLWYLTALVVVLLFQLTVLVPQHMRFKTVQNANSIVLALTELWMFPAYWACLVTAIRGLCFTWWISKLFGEFRIRLWFLHPDGCGGLGAIGAYVAKTGYIIAVWGSVIAVVILTENRQLTGQLGRPYFGPVILPPLIAYLLLAPLAFFAPMWTAHLAMKQARDEELQRIAEDFNRGLLDLQEKRRYKVASLKPHMERLEDLEKLSHIIASTPTWPFRLPDLVRFFTRTFIPVVVTALPAVIEILVKLL